MKPHERAESVYYVLRGKGIVELDGKRVLLEAHTGVLMSPGLKHDIYNTGLEDLLFIVVACFPTTCPGSRVSPTARQYV